MLVPLSWLKQYVSWDVPLDELCSVLTHAGLEVGNIDKVGEEWNRETIWVAEVVSIRQHPNADRLVLVTLNYGAEDTIEVVTGAPNLKVGDSGQKVVFAMVGSTLRDPYAEGVVYKKLKKSKIRGVDSVGMVCSEKELGISEEHEGIIILPDDAPVGTPFADYFGDTVLDLDLTPNLARCFSMAGVARDAAALLGTTYTPPSEDLVATGPSIEGQVDISIADPDLCPRYSASLIRACKIGPSPHWMQRYLTLAGMRPINNIVDITNYVMLEMGQPLHSFDLETVRPGKEGGVPTIIVRRAQQGEKMATLDGQEHTFDGDMLLITDGQGPVGIAGVMGGLDSEVTETTTDVLLEAANFDFISVRRTSGMLKIPSEAAQRFGRGVDPELTLATLRRASELMRVYCGGTVAEGFIDLYPGKLEITVVTLPASTVHRSLGVQLPVDEIADMLTPLGFTCEQVEAKEPTLAVTVPSYRFDVTIPADLCEEVARMYGYDKLPTTLISDEMPRQERNVALEMEQDVRRLLVGMGLTEILTYSMTNMESVSKLTPDATPVDDADYLRVANPLTRENEYMRQTLMNTSLEVIAKNLRFVDRVAIFELARVYLPVEGQKLPDEPTKLSVALSGPREERSWVANESAPFDFYDIKGVAEALCEHLGVQDIQWEPIDQAPYRPGRAATFSADGKVIGTLGEVHPLVCRNYDMPDGQTVCLLEVDVAALMAASQTIRRFQAISRMPAVKQDLALVVDEGVPADAIQATIQQVAGPLLTEIVLFDVYRGEQVGEGKKSLAYSLAFQAPNKTLTSDQATRQRNRIVMQLQRQYGADIRG